VPIEGTARDLSALAGRWEGEYESPATGRLGSIVFDLTAGADHAKGDVLMIPRGSTTSYGPMPRTGQESPSPAATSQILTIRFVKAEGGKVRSRRHDRGTFASSRNAGRVFGTWKATEKVGAVVPLIR
jgi:hypothetical protein